MIINPPAATVAVTNGTYTGDNTVNRAIAHGLGVVPKFVFCANATDGQSISQLAGAGRCYHTSASLTVTAADTTNFYVGNATQYGRSANADTLVYTWAAI